MVGATGVLKQKRFSIRDFAPTPPPWPCVLAPGVGEVAKNLGMEKNASVRLSRTVRVSQTGPFKAQKA